MNNFKGKKIGILGIGEENTAIASYLLKRGTKVVVCDQKSEGELGPIYKQIKNWPVEFRLGPGYLEGLNDFEIVFRTPGLPYLHPKIQTAKKEGLEISSEIKYFFAHCPCPIIGVTGTKGKGTTTSLIGEILEKTYAGKEGKIFVGGNIGHPPILFLDQLKQKDLVVLELSSFQLQDLYCSPHIAVLLDVKIDHLDYHKDEKEYVDAKANILRYQGKKDYAVINADYLTSFELGLISPGELYWFSRRKSIDQGIWVKNKEELILRYHNKDYPIIKVAEITLRGEHNWENIAAAATASFLAGADLDSIKNTIKSFPGLEHRLEFIAQVDGIKFYNDSFSTTPDTAIAAIKSFGEPLILIVGGSEKRADYSELGRAIASSTVKEVILIGKTGQKIGTAIEKASKQRKRKINIIRDSKNFEEAVKQAKIKAKSGDVILLSPASASFDWFRNYKDRGNQFKNAILRKFL